MPDHAVAPETSLEALDTDASTPSLRRWLVGAAAVSTVVALYVWDDVLFATPIIALSAWLSPWASFLILTPVWFVGGAALALAAVRAHDRATKGRPSRLETWLEHQVEGRRGRNARRLTAAGGAVGFVLASVLLSGVVTTWLIRYGGRREGLVKVACASSAINGVAFVGMYSGLASLVF